MQQIRKKKINLSGDRTGMEYKDCFECGQQPIYLILHLYVLCKYTVMRKSYSTPSTMSSISKENLLISLKMVT